MKKLNIATTGYYGSTESWKWVADSYEMIAEALAKLLHRDDAVIITGVNVVGNDVSDGLISYAGELYRFVGGAKTDTVVIIEDKIQTEYNTNPTNSGQLELHDTYINRYAKCGQQGEGVSEFLFDDLTRINELISISELTTPATENKRGTMEIATQQETDEGTDDTKAITPAKLAGRTATEDRTGVIAIATDQEVLDGQDDSKAITPAKLNEFWENGIIKGTVTCDHYGSYQVNLPVTIPNANYIVLAQIRTNAGQDNSTVVITDRFPDYFTAVTKKADDPTYSGATENWIDYMVVKL